MCVDLVKIFLQLWSTRSDKILKKILNRCLSFHIKKIVIKQLVQNFESSSFRINDILYKIWFTPTVNNEETFLISKYFLVILKHLLRSYLHSNMFRIFKFSKYTLVCYPPRNVQTVCYCIFVSYFIYVVSFYEMFEICCHFKKITNH